MKGFIAAFETARAVALAIEHMKIKNLIFTLLSFLALSLGLSAQTSSDVSGVTLTGQTNDPIIHNHSGKTVLVARWSQIREGGLKADGLMWFVDPARGTTGLADGSSGKIAYKPIKARVISATLVGVFFLTANLGVPIRTLSGISWKLLFS